MCKLFSIFSFVLLYITVAFGQVAVDIPVTVTDNVGSSVVLNFGLDPTATDGIDPLLGESDLAPPPPGNAFDGRWWLPPFDGILSSLKDYRNAPSFPYSGNVQHVIKFQTTDYPVTVSWDLPPEIAATSTIQDPFGLDIQSFSGIGSITVTNAAIGQLNVSIDYNGISGADPGPLFVADPDPLDFGDVEVGVTTIRTLTVSNPGTTNPLEVMNVDVFPPFELVDPNIGWMGFTVPPGGSVNIDIQITPPHSGPAQGMAFFMAMTGFYEVQLLANGVEPGPLCVVNPTSLDFGPVGVGESSTLILNISNPGTTNPLQIFGATFPPEFDIFPPLMFDMLFPGESRDYQVTFTPTDYSVVSGDITIDHDAPGSPTVVPVTGSGYMLQGGDLVFDPQVRTIFDNAQGYSTAIRLENYVGDDLKALQFKVVLDGLLLFRSISRGAAITSPEWNFSYEIAPGILNADGSRNDTIKVVLIGNGTNQLAPGNYELAVLEYDAVDIQANQLTTTVHYEEVIGATGTPNPGGDANVTAGPAQDITINNRVFYGDVNIDDRVDILDLLLMTDYILDRVTFNTEQITRGDISPWTSGATPSPDGEINAMDLALLQNIILTGHYPSGEPATTPIQNPNYVENLEKLNPGDDAALTFYINQNGIAVVLESIVNVKGLQVNFSNVVNSTSGMGVETELGNGYFLQDEDIVRVLVYDGNGETLAPGEYLFLNMPFAITTPRDIKIDEIILASEDNERIEKLSIQVIYNSEAPWLPTEYSLSQNYPNPFNPSTEVQFTVPNTSEVSIIIYDMLGQEVRTLFTGQVQRGTYSANWDGTSNTGQKMSSGSYIYRMISGDYVQAKKMILMK